MAFRITSYNVCYTKLLRGHGLRLRPGLLFGLVLVILGMQFLSLGAGTFGERWGEAWQTAPELV